MAGANTADILFRTATPADLPEIRTLVKEAIREMRKNQIDQWDSAYPSESDFLTDIEKAQLFIGLIDGAIAVIYTLNQDCDEEYKNGSWKTGGAFYVIHRLCVSPRFQNQGVAGRALENIERSLRRLGAAAIRLDVFTKNPFALKLYERSGYKTVGCADWRKGRFLLMEKQLI